LFGKLRDIKSPWIGDIRGQGLLIGVEIVTDAAKTPLSEARMMKLLRDIREAGVLVGRNNDSAPGFCNVLIISPPLILTRAEADTIAAAVESGLARL
jgi:4-aminobutyrate aminotransferase-like enzyme